MIGLFNFNNSLNLSPGMYWSVYTSIQWRRIYKEMRLRNFNFISRLYGGCTGY